MSDSAVDRNLLFGILALQNNFINREALLGAFASWVVDKRRPLGEILCEQGKLTPPQNELLRALTEEHVKQHGNDPEQSLAAVSAVGSIHDELRKLGDPQLEATLALVAQNRPDVDLFDTTLAYSAEAWSGTGQRFRVLRPHAKGGLGEVFVAQDLELHREVALKEIQSQFADQPSSRSRFMLEAEITGGLEHPGIVPVYGLGQYADGRPYYAMRFIRGDSLKEAIEQFHASPATGAAYGSVDFRKLLGRFIDVCQAIEYAHSRGVLHRDLKPGNIMLGKYGETLVVDWGLAKAAGKSDQFATSAEATLVPSSGSSVERTQMGAAIGTPAYMSPEQAVGRLDQLGPATDVYSLGATLYEVLTGQSPYVDLPLLELLARVKRGEFPRPSELNSHVPKALEAVCLKAMVLRPEDRYSTAAEIAEDVERWLADEPVRVYREPLPARARRWVKRHPALVVGTAATILISLVSLAVIASIIGQSNRSLAAKNSQLQQANQREREATSLAQQNEEIARKQSQLALKSLEFVIVDIQQDLRALPGAGGVRRKLIQTALARLEEVSDQFASRSAIDRNTMIGLNDLGDVFLRIGSGAQGDANADRPVTAARKMYQRAFEIAEQLAAADANGDSTLNRQQEVRQPQHDLAVAHNKLGDVSLQMGQATEALRHYQQGLEISLKMAADDPTDHQALRDLSVSYESLGNLSHRAGKFTEAVGHYQKLLELRQKLAASDPGNETGSTRLQKDSQAQRDLADAYNRLGDVLLEADAYDVLLESEQRTEALGAYQQALEINQTLASVDPNDAQVLRGLSISNIKLGSVLPIGQVTAAVERYQKALEICQKLALADPTDAQAQRDLWRAHGRFGNVLQRSGRLTEALEQYQKSLEISRTSAVADPSDADAQRDLAIAYLWLGSLLRVSGKQTEALEQYRNALEISQKLAAIDPNDVGAQRNLAYPFEQVGDVLIHIGRATEAIGPYQQLVEIIQKWAAAEPNHIWSRRYLSACFQRLGNANRQAGLVAEALDHYQKALENLQKLAAAAPNEPQVLRDLSAAYVIPSELLFQSGEAAEAIEMLQKSVEIRQKLATANPNDTSAQRDTCDFYHQISEKLHQFGKLTESLEPLQKLVEVRQKLAAANPNDAQAQRDLYFWYDRLGDRLNESEKMTEAIEQYRNALDIKQKVAAADPSDVQAQRDQVYSYHRIGDLLLHIGHANEAIEQYQKALEIHQNLATANPSDILTQRYLSSCFHRLGNASRQAGLVADASGHYQKAREILQTLAAAAPNDIQVLRELSDMYVIRSEILFQSGQATEANEMLQKALEIHQKGLELSQKAAAGNPSDIQTQVDVVNGHIQIAGVHQKQKQYEQAIESYGRGLQVLQSMKEQKRLPPTPENWIGIVEQAMQECQHASTALGDWKTLLEQPADLLPMLLDMRGIQFAREGRASDAIQAATKLRELGTATANQLYNAACVYSLCAAGIKAEKDELTADQTANRQMRIDDALATLREAIKAGWKDFAHMQQDSDLTVLRELAEFKALLPQIDQPKP